MGTFIYHGIPSIIGALFCIIFLAICIPKYKNKDFSQKRKPLIFLYILLIVMEFLKIFANIAYTKSYTPSRYPIIFCSFVMFSYPIICHVKKDTMAWRIATALSIIPCVVIGGLYLFIFPYHSMDISPFYYVMNIHSRFYHFCMLAGALYMTFTKFYDFRFKDSFAVGLTAGAYFIFCIILSLFIGGDLSYFGPNSEPMSLIYDTFGYAVGNVLLVILCMALSYSVYGIIYVINKKIKKRKQKLKNI